MHQHRMPSVFLCHGGGPWPWMHGPFRAKFSGLAHTLRSVPAQLPQRPKVILVVSAHWEEAVFTVSAAARPQMVYDCAGLPPETCAIRCDSPGSPALADRVVALLGGAGLPAQASPIYGERLVGQVAISSFRFGQSPEAVA